VTPVELAAAVYEREPCARTFREDLEAHLRRGWVYGRPDFFAMGRPVDSKAERGDIVNPWVQFASPDAWLVYLMAGDWRRALSLLPYPLPLIGWERGNILRFWSLHSLQRRVKTAGFAEFII
jgi:hypothetical protein